MNDTDHTQLREDFVKRSDFDMDRYNSAQELKANDNFTPCPVNEGDELYPNGIFVFNLTKMLEHIKKNPNEFDLIEITVADFPRSFSSINESHVDTVDVEQPVIIAEISPGHYNLIDGNHRMEKARRLGKSSVFAYKLNVEQHIEFLTERKAYLSYIDYWNGKIR